uniref:2-oxoglutarate dehydrogenase, mitochondrial n=3 Tax=Ciona intestinalis TaxID=7719 RepID=F6UHA9_CIOIN
MLRSQASFRVLQQMFTLNRTSSVLTRNLARNPIKTLCGSNTPRRHYASTSLTNQQATAAAAKAEPFLSGSNTLYIEEMYESWLEDPKSVHKSWDAYFKNVSAGAVPGQAYQSPPDIGSSPMSAPQAGGIPIDGAQIKEVVDKHLSVQSLIRGYQIRGHSVAMLDPLGILDADLDSTTPPELMLNSYSLGEAEMNNIYQLPQTTMIGGGETTLPLHEIIKRLENSYCRSIGVEYMFINNYEQCNWIRQQFEPPGITKLTDNEKRL